MHPTFTANIYLPSCVFGQSGVHAVYHVMQLGKNYDSYRDAVNAAMAETTKYPTAAGFVIKQSPPPLLEKAKMI